MYSDLTEEKIREHLAEVFYGRYINKSEKLHNFVGYIGGGWYRIGPGCHTDINGFIKFQELVREKFKTDNMEGQENKMTLEEAMELMHKQPVEWKKEPTPNRPICVIYIDKEVVSIGERTLDNFRKGMFDMLDSDYHVLVVPINNVEKTLELQVFHPKDFTETDYQSLYNLIHGELNKITTDDKG